MPSPRKPRVSPKSVAAKAGKAADAPAKKPVAGDTADPYAGGDVQKEFDAVGEQLDQAVADSGGMATQDDPVDSNDDMPPPPKPKRKSRGSRSKKAQAAEKAAPQAAAQSQAQAESQQGQQAADQAAPQPQARPKPKSRPRPRPEVYTSMLVKGKNNNGNVLYSIQNENGELTTVGMELKNGRVMKVPSGEVTTLKELAAEFEYTPPAPDTPGVDTSAQPQPEPDPQMPKTPQEQIAEEMQKRQDALEARRLRADAMYPGIPESLRYDSTAQMAADAGGFLRRNKLLASLLGGGAAGLVYAMSGRRDQQDANANALDFLGPAQPMSPVTGQPMPMSSPAVDPTMNPYMYMQQQRQSPVGGLLGP